jgi:hypothetical protein
LSGSRGQFTFFRQQHLAVAPAFVRKKVNYLQHLPFYAAAMIRA